MMPTKKNDTGSRRSISCSSGAPFPTLALLCLMLSLLFTLSTCSAEVVDVVAATPDGASSEPLIRVIVGFESSQDQDSYVQESPLVVTDRASTIGQQQLVYRYQRSAAIAMTIPASQLEQLQQDPRVTYVNPDQQFVLFQVDGGDDGQGNGEATPPVVDVNSGGEEILPYGIQVVQGASSKIPPPQVTDSSCQNPDSFKVCVVDSGLLVGHTDIPYASSVAENIRGEVFGLPNDLNWYEPSAGSSHGTHVTGTILAQANNGLGVVGVVPNAASEGICLLVARTFDATGFQDASFITEAVEWCAQQGAKVISMSLGSNAGLDQADADVYDRLWGDEDVLIIAAAGNAGNDKLAYPASLDSVMSIAATDEFMKRADFSQFNNQVDLTAPGVNILSTTSSNALFVSSLNAKVDAALMQFSPDAPDSFLLESLELVDCGFGFAPCTDAKDKACLIERGTTFFWEKALNCQAGDGVAVFVYNNEGGKYGGSLTDQNHGVKIPTYAMARKDGLLILEQGLPTSVLLQAAAASYGFLDGTSMATPHVSGVAAKIWAARPSCTNRQIREALVGSAIDLGDAGRDDEFGFGLVQAEAAFDYIQTQFDPPCGGVLEVTPPPPARNCTENFISCARAEDCCSGRCVPVSFQGPLTCRAVQKNTKNKISGDIRGGSASGGRRYLGQSTDVGSLQRIRGASSSSSSSKGQLNEEREPEPTELVNDEESSHHQAKLPPSQDRHHHPLAPLRNQTTPEFLASSFRKKRFEASVTK